MHIVIFLIFICLITFFPFFRVITLHFFEWLFLSFSDLFKYFRSRSFNTCPCGTITCYSGLFGYGKTLSAIHHIRNLYFKYQDKPVFYKGSWRKNKIIVLSNVTFLDVPFIHLSSMRQIVETCRKLDFLEKDKYCVTFLILIDEASTQLNSRDFKTNISPMFLNTLLTSRHYRMSIYYTSQRFLLVDKLLREVTFDVVECRRIGRVQCQKIYSAFELENCSNISLVKCKSRRAWLIRNEDYNAYDTTACVDNLEKDMINGRMLSTEEILKSIENLDNLNNVNLKSSVKRRLKKVGGV